MIPDGVEIVPAMLARHDDGLLYRVDRLIDSTTDYEENGRVLLGEVRVDYTQLEDGNYEAGKEWSKDLPGFRKYFTVEEQSTDEKAEIDMSSPLITMVDHYDVEHGAHQIPIITKAKLERLYTNLLGDGGDRIVWDTLMKLQRTVYRDEFAGLVVTQQYNRNHLGLNAERLPALKELLESGALRKANLLPSEKELLAGVLDAVRPVKIEPASSLADVESLRPILEQHVRDSKKPHDIIHEEIDGILAAVTQSKDDGSDYSYAFAFQGGNVVGMLGMRKPEPRMLPHAETKNPVEFFNAFVAEKSQGLGIGPKLFEYVRSAASEAGATELVVNSGRRYESTGWPFWRKVLGEEYFGVLDFYGKGGNALVWRQRLPAQPAAEQV